MTGDRYAFRQRFNRWKQGERYWSIIGQPLPHYADGKDGDQEYYGYMERLANKKAGDWAQVPLRIDPDATLTEMLNDNTYNYRTFYDNDRYLAEGMLYDNPYAHFSDTGKTVYHPTFSTDSSYSNRKSDYNPEGIEGGSWINNEYRVSRDQMNSKYFNPKRTLNYLKHSDPNIQMVLPQYRGGKDSDLFYKNLYPKNIDTSEYDFAKKVWNYDDQQAMKFVHDIYQIFPDHYEVYAGELPEVVVKPDPNSKSQVTLTTYYPMVSAYPYTGHSKLKTEGGNIIDVKSNDVGYNLITNNCSDATRKALEMASGKKMNNWFFTTPGDVKDFAEQLGGRTFYPGYGRAVTKLDLPTEGVRKIAEYSKKLSLEKHYQHSKKIRPVKK